MTDRDAATSAREGLEPIRQQMRGLQRRTSDLFESAMTSSTRARSGSEYLLPYVASWVRYVQYAVTAVRSLHDAGLGHYAAPIRRAILEHAISLAMVERDPESFIAFVRGLRKDSHRVQLALAKIDIATEADLRAVTEWDTEPGSERYDSLQHVKHRCEKLGELGDRLYAAWIEETMLSHANYATAALFLQGTHGDDAPTLTLEAQVPVSDWHADAQIADSFLLAVDVFSRTLVDDPLREGINRLNAEKTEMLARAENLVGRRSRLTNRSV